MYNSNFLSTQDLRSNGSETATALVRGDGRTRLGSDPRLDTPLYATPFPQHFPGVTLRSKGSTPVGASYRHSYHEGISAIPLQSNFLPAQRNSRAWMPTMQATPEYDVPDVVFRNSSRTSKRSSIEDWNKCNKDRSSNISQLRSLEEEELRERNRIAMSGSARDIASVDTMQQGSELADSPKGTSVVGGPTGYPITSSVDAIHGHAQNLNQNATPSSGHPQQGTGIPLQGQVLVDPATGQHYIVPQAAFYPQPMYYPPPQPTPMYYPYGAQGYVLPQGQLGAGHGAYPMPIPGAHPVPHPQYPGAHQAAQRQFSTTPPYREYGQNQHASSNEDVSRRDMDDRRLEDPHSPSFSMHSMQYPQAPQQYNMPHAAPFPQQQQQQQSRNRQQNVPCNNANRSSPNSQPEDPESGFRRDVTRSSAEFVRHQEKLSRQSSAENFVRNGSGEFVRYTNQMGNERTPLYGGPPQWWGRGNREEADSLTDVDSKRERSLRASPPSQSTVSDTEMRYHRPQVSPVAPQQPLVRPPPAKPVRMDFDFNKLPEVEEKPKPKPTAKPVRMDIDLSKKLPEEEELEREREEKRLLAAQKAAAFTVTFDSNDGLSLQDAARKSAQARRMLNRRLGTTTGSQKAPSVQQGSERGNSQQEDSSNKGYLLNKLLHGSETSNHQEFSGLMVPRDNDAQSDAGTYVVDCSGRSGATAATRLMPSRVIEESDSDSDTSSSSSSRSASPERPSNRNSVQQSAVKTPTTSAGGGQDILNGLLKLRQMTQGVRPPSSQAQSPLPTAASPTVGRRSCAVTPHSRVSTSGAVLPPPSSATTPSVYSKRVSMGMQPANSRLARPQTTGHSTTSNASNTNTFRRVDGGRYSMRGVGSGGPAAVSSPQSGQKRPPFRTGGALVKPQQRDQEMNAWLRRKDYNPMRAAAEARKAKEKECKNREDQFASNRSISFHVGPSKNHRMISDSGSEISRNRSEESLAADEAEQASQRVIAEYSRGVVKNISKLSKQSSNATGKQLTGLERAVDMLSIKCKKSIELIRSQNKGCLSVSVEDLLAAAADPPRPQESLNDQLDRLSDAFDAVQRYLEQYSLDGHESPIPEFSEASEMHPAGGSVVSAYSVPSMRSPHAARESEITRPGGSLAGAQTAVSPGYRSRVLNQSPPTYDRNQETY